MSPRVLTAALALLGLGLAGGASGSAPARAEERPNVLFLAVDDLRPELGCYGARHMVTPNLDRLAARGRLFRSHYAQVPTCGASRYALWTGRYPRQARALGNGAFVLAPRAEPAEAYSLPQLFRRNGYATESLGKISHSPDGLAGGEDGAPRTGSERPELPFSWDRMWGPAGEWGTPWKGFFAYAGGKSRTRGVTPAFEGADVPDTGYPDGLLAAETIARLGALKDRPFFLAAGFYKPHLPFNAPKKYWDLYDPAKLPLAPHGTPPAGVDPAISLHPSGELLGQYTEAAANRVVTEAHARRLRHGYFAGVSYVDAQIGKVLDELDRLGLAEKTLVVVWGDHGWHLGDHGVWGKHTLHDRSLRSTLIMRAPGQKQPGAATAAAVESVDLFPTLARACRLTPPAGLDGHDLGPLLSDPAAASIQPVRGFWQKGELQGRTVSLAPHRFTRWTRKDGTVAQVELYDHRTDPNETTNVAAQHPDVVERLRKALLPEG